MKLKEELNKIVLDFEVRSNLIDELTEEAFDNLVAACKTAAERGKHCVKDVPLHFAGCTGVNSKYAEKISFKLAKMLNNEDLKYVFNSVLVPTIVTISW